MEPFGMPPDIDQDAAAGGARSSPWTLVLSGGGGPAIIPYETFSNVPAELLGPDYKRTLLRLIELIGISLQTLCVKRTMHWVYIMECDYERLYVGETTRLYRRFLEHWKGEGGVNTRVFNPIQIAAIYKVQTLGKFRSYDYDVDWAVNNDPKNELGKYNKWKLVKFEDDKEGEHDNLDAENIITECLMMSFGQTKHVRGGKYTRIDKQYELPNNELFKRLPFCNCGLPCDVKKCRDKDVLYFRCPRKNIWDGLRESFECCDEPCKFYQEYNHDINLRNMSTWKSRKHIIRDLFAEED